MNSLCEQIRQLISHSSVTLQETLTLEASAARAAQEGRAAPSLSQRMIELISDLTRVDLQANLLSQEQQQKERDTAKHMRMMKDVIVRQQREIERLSVAPPVCVSVCTDTCELEEEQSRRRDEAEAAAQRSMHSLQSTTARLQALLEKAIAENRRLRAALQRSTTLMKAQEALLEEHESAAVSHSLSLARRHHLSRRPRLDLFDDRDRTTRANNNNEQQQSPQSHPKESQEQRDYEDYYSAREYDRDRFVKDEEQSDRDRDKSILSVERDNNIRSPPQSSLSPPAITPSVSAKGSVDDELRSLSLYLSQDRRPPSSAKQRVRYAQEDECVNTSCDTTTTASTVATARSSQDSLSLSVSAHSTQPLPNSPPNSNATLSPRPSEDISAILSPTKTTSRINPTNLHSPDLSHPSEGETPSTSLAEISRITSSSMSAGSANSREQWPSESGDSFALIKHYYDCNLSAQSDLSRSFIPSEEDSEQSPNITL